MAIRNSRPYKFSGRGLSDTLDGSNVFAGAMSKLTNLIPDPTTEGQWVCRPAYIELTNSLGNPWSSGWSTGFGPLSSVSNGAISAMIVIGTRVYGMMSTYLFPGFDVPFCYDLPTAAFIMISGVTGANTPTVLAPTGDWIPPTMTLVGTKIVVCHQGFVAPIFVGFIDITNPAAPAWSSGDLSGAISLASPPYACGQFNGRAYYLVNPVGGQPAIIFSDALAPDTVTNSTQVLTLDDNLTLTATIGLPLNAQQGGIIQSLLVFKGASNIYQITGDAATNDLAVNALNAATGTLAPNSIAPTPKGIAFAAPDGLRYIDFLARVSDPVGLNGSGVSVPIMAALTPSRIAAAYSGNVYRITVINGAGLGTPSEEYWLDFSQQRWSGPHTSTFAHIRPYRGTFVGQPIAGYGLLVQSNTMQSATSSFVENGSQLLFTWQCAMLPDTEQMAENAMVETTLNVALSPGDIYTISAVDQNNSPFDTLQITAQGQATLWGAFQWGQALWGGAQFGIAPQQLAWHYPIVFRRLAIAFSGESALAVKIGTMFLRYEELGYLQQTLTGT